MFSHTQQEIWTGVAMAAIGGASAGVYVFRSGKLYAKASCTTLEILCSRFFLLLLVTGFLGLGGIVNAAAAQPMILPRLIMLACVSVVIPMFALQYSVQTLGASKTSIITPSVPAIALALEQVLKGWPSIWIPVLIVTTCLALILANYWMNREKLLANRLQSSGAGNARYGSASN
jgi:drug/metabolite transporter (DMT)-like permease